MKSETEVCTRKPLEMREIQMVSLEILKFITKICENNGFRYCLMYGTLIGAIRHKGYIPWDDDVDIAMPRPDYEAFLEYAQNHNDEFGIYKIFNRNSHKDYRYDITRVSDSRYIIKTGDKYSCGMGIFVDIYPYEGLGNDEEAAIRTLTLARKITNNIFKTVWCSLIPPSSLNYKGKIVYFIKQLKNKTLGSKRLFGKLEKLRVKEFSGSEYVGPLWFFTKPEKVLFKKSIFENMIKVPFEDGNFYVPANYDALLTQEYGDYMQLPPIEKRIYHHQYKAYKK